MVLLDATPENRIPYRLANPSQCGPYSAGESRAVPIAAVKVPVNQLCRPKVCWAAHCIRSLPEIARYGAFAEITFTLCSTGAWVAIGASGFCGCLELIAG